MPDDLKHEPVVRTETCSLAAVRRVAAMLDLDPEKFAGGDPLPRGWQFILLGADTRRSRLRSDGFAGFGVPMPDLGLPRLVLGGRTVEYGDEIPIGTPVKRVSVIKNITRKDIGMQKMAFVTIGHEMFLPAKPEPVLVETQTYVLMSGKNSGVEDAPGHVPIAAEKQKVVVPDETLLYQYSALGFNSHKIHLDKTYAREVEGFPDLVVNGGLATLLLTEFLRTDLELSAVSLKVRHLAPLYCHRRLTLAASKDAHGWRLRAHNEFARIAIEMEVKVK